MNTKGQFNNQLSVTMLYLIIFVLFFVGMLFFINRYQNGASLWEEFYAKNIVGVIDSANVGDEIYLDVTKATEIAIKSGVDKNEIFSFDNLNNKLIVKLSPDGGTSFKFFKDVDIVNWSLEFVSGDAKTNRLKFSIARVREDDK